MKPISIFEMGFLFYKAAPGGKGRGDRKAKIKLPSGNFD
jgi:hypothetical protein